MLKFKYLVKPADFDASIKWAADVFRHTTYRDDWAVPTEPGFCVKGALIGGPDYNSEALVQYWWIDGVGIFGIDMRDAVDVDEQSSLLKDLAGLKASLRADGYSGHVKVLREGKRTVAGMDTEEVLFSIKGGGVQLFTFYLLALGRADTITHPHIAIEFLVGSPPEEGELSAKDATSPISEEQAIQVWDTLLNSMRLRPNAI